MKQAKRRWFPIGTFVPFLSAFICLSQAVRGQDDVPPPGPSTPPPLATKAVSEPLFTIPGEIEDPAFAKFVDLTLLGHAYLNNDVELMTDVGLQLAEGERVLLRAHRGLKSAAILDVALRMATEQRHLESLDRLEKTGDKEFRDRVQLARQLADKPRAAVAELPPPDESQDPEEFQREQALLHRFERDRSVGDMAALKRLQAELKAKPGKAGSLTAYVKKQVDEALIDVPDDIKSDATIDALSQLSGASRGVTGPYLERTSDLAVYEGARAYYLESSRPDLIYISVPGKPAGGGINEWVPKTSYYGLKGRFGTVYINLDWRKEVKIEQGQEVATGRWFRVYEANPDYVQIAMYNVQKKAYDYEWTGLKDAILLKFQNEPVNANAIVAAGGGNMQFAKIVAAGGGNFYWNEIVAAGGGNLSLSQLKDAGGGGIWPDKYGIPAAIYDAAGRNPNGGATINNIVAAGGGNVLVKGIVAAGGGNVKPIVPSNIVAAGGGNILNRISTVNTLIQDGGAYLRHANTVKLISKGGAGVASYGLKSVGSSPFSNAKRY